VSAAVIIEYGERLRLVLERLHAVGLALADAAALDTRATADLTLVQWHLDLRELRRPSCQRTLVGREHECVPKWVSGWATQLVH
jgi:hypothetical protein